jgi:hypothetical protein
MAKLCVFLPPFAPDYSGVCSALFDMNALIMIHDAAGCTGNYTGFDEPRWYGSVRRIYCSGLRRNDAILGGEDKFIVRIQKALSGGPAPDFIALVGSPVPMVIGTDFDGFAAEVQAATGITAFGFPTDGTRYYTDGVFLALRTLIEHYAEETPRIKGLVNVLGATPLDFTHDGYVSVARAVDAAGCRMNVSMSAHIEHIRAIGGAEINLAVSESGRMLAVYLKARFGTPYLCGIPAEDGEWADALASCRASGADAYLPAGVQGDGGALIIGDRIAAHSLRRRLRCNAKIGVLFGKNASEPQFADDVYLPDEMSVTEEVNHEKYELIVADPLICELVKDKKRVPAAHFAVSGEMGRGHSLLSPEITAILKQELR